MNDNDVKIDEEDYEPQELPFSERDTRRMPAIVIDEKPTNEKTTKIHIVKSKKQVYPFNKNIRM